tara:strand:+ start:676 stop:864 length:189 start_codon:yes stop_codon:yes gene_type:complete
LTFTVGAGDALNAVRTKMILEILNRVDGMKHLLAIGDRRGSSILEFVDAARDLRWVSFLSVV